MRKVVFAAAAVLLAGCGALNGVDPQVDYAVLDSDTRACSAPPSRTATPRMMLDEGFTYIRASCEAYFVAATRAQRDALYGNKVLDASLLGTTAVLGVTASPAAAIKTVAITAAIINLGKEVINQANAIYTFGNHLYKVKQLVDGSMDQYIAGNKGFQPESFCEAHEIVTGLARLCSLATMQSLLDQQVAIPSKVKPPAAPPAAMMWRMQSGPPGSRPLVVRPISNSATGYTVQPLR